MLLRAIGRTMLAGAMLVCIVPALSGCVGNGDAGPELTLAGLDTLQTWEAPSPFSGDSTLATGATADPAALLEQGILSSWSGGSTSTNATPSRHQRALQTSLATRQSGAVADTDTSGDGATDEIPLPTGSVVTPGSEQGSLPQAEHLRENLEAADLLDYWGHRRVQSIVEGLSLSTAASQADGADFKRLRAAAQAREGKPLAPDLHVGDDVRILGSRRGVTYGRWTGGPADTLSIDFDLSRAGPVMRGDPTFRALLERTGKAWSHRIADTWASWDQAPGDLQGWLWQENDDSTEVRVGAKGETSSGLKIYVRDASLSNDYAGQGVPGVLPPLQKWESHFGQVRIDREYFSKASERSLLAVLGHEIGHVLGAWSGAPGTKGYTAYTDEATGTWTGPNVVAVHGGPAPFQDVADPHAWVNGERSPLASEFDFVHSGVCSSLMAYCSSKAPIPAFLPHAIDFAFLADLGMTVTDETTRPETYGLAGWTDYAGFSLSVSRDLQMALSNRQSGNDGYARHPNTLDVTDLLQVEVDVFGNRSAGDLLQSYPAEGLLGTVRYAGGLLGAAIDRAGLPPVTGDTSLAVNLGTLDGTASFTSLQVHTRGTPEIFSGGSLHYPFGLSANGILGTDTASTLRADFYGPGHENIAGALHDPRVGLLASFGATHDDRPSREDVVASADHMLGRSYRSGAVDPTAVGWSHYRCGTASACETRHAGSDGWTDWTTTTRSEVLASTAGWTWRSAERPHADRDVARIARHSVESTDGLQGSHVVDGYTGTLEHVAFGTGFERYTNWSPLSNGAFPDTDYFFNKWAGVQGTVSGAPPDESARWSGLMLGYQGGRAAGETPFVKGLASIQFSLSDNRLDVAFSEVASRDGRRTLRDFAFKDLQVEQVGTFGRNGAAGTMDGALYGPSQGEVAGAFHHNASNVTGGFGARRLPDTAALEESDASETRPAIVDVDDTRYVGADAAPALDRLTAAGDYGGVAVSSGQVQDGAGTERVLAYLKRHIDEDYNNWIPGLATFPARPVVRVARGTSEELAAYTETAVRLINSALPREDRIVFSRDPAPRSTAIENVPEGEIFVNFARTQDWNLREGHTYEPDWFMSYETDAISEFNESAQRHENKGMRAAHVWFNSWVISNAAWVRDPDTNTWKYQVLDAPTIESDTTEKVYTGEKVIRPIVRIMLKALGLYGFVDESEFPDSILAHNRHRLPNIDNEGLLAAYTRLTPGTQPEDLSAESLGPWNDTSFHLRGDLDFAGGEAAFGVALRNGLARPWASGSAPLAALENNSALFGTVNWNGALLGVTPSAETVAGHARLAVELSTLDGQLDFTGLEHWGVKKAPGKVGTGATWGDGDLEYSIEVQGNSFYRTGGDDGEVVGAFFGAAHEAMGGVLERSDLAAGFGGTR